MKKIGESFEALRYRNFRLLWLGMFISRIGSEMQIVAVGWQMYILTQSAVSLGLIGLFRFLPLIIFSLLGGVIADTVDRRKLMVVTQLAMALTSLTLTVTTFTGHISPALIYLLIAIHSAASSIDSPTRQSLIPALVPKDMLFKAISVNVFMWQSSVVLGPALGGLIIASFGIGSVYLVDALSFIAVIWALFAMDPLATRIRQDTRISLYSLGEGLKFMLEKPVILAMMLLDFFASFFASATLLLPIFARDILAVGPQGLGILYSAPAIGAILASLIMSTVGQIKQQGKIVVAAVLIYGLATIFFGLSNVFVLSLLFLFVTGFADAVSMIIRHTVRQIITPDHLRGRMGSYNMIFSMGGPQLGELEAGLVAAALGAPGSVVVGGVGAIIATLLIAYFIPQLRKHHSIA